MAVPQELMFQNQLLFNLNVPLTTHNMATHFHRPPPITIHRSAATASHDAFPLAQLANLQNNMAAGGGGGPSGPTPTANPDFQFSVLSQDRMAAAVQLAKRDLKNQKQQGESFRVGGRGRSLSPPLAAKQQQQQQQSKLIYGTRQWENRRSRAVSKKTVGGGGKGSAAVGRGKKVVVGGVQDGSRMSRSAHSSPPPPQHHSYAQRQAFINTKISPERGGGSESPGPPTRDTPSLTRVSQQPADDIERLQLEMELCLQQIESVQTRALSEHNTDFLRPQSGKKNPESQQQRECALWLKGDDVGGDEYEGRRKERAKEQTHRSLRTIYNLRQQLKEMEKQALKLPRDCRATKKSQASQRLVMINKGAVKLLQTFVSQLPYQDLRSGLPSHFSELADLIRQVTLLSAGVAPSAAPVTSAQQDSGKKERESSGGNKASSALSQLSPIEADVMAMVNHVERLNCDWQRDVINREVSAPVHSNKPPFVTNFKSNKSAFTKEQISHSELQEKLHRERKAMLQEGFRALLKKANLSVNKAGGVGGRSKGEGNPYKTLNVPPPPPPPMTPHKPSRQRKKAPLTRKPRPARKGFLLPAKVRTQRTAEQRQPSQGASVSSTHFADPTITANLKASNMLHNPFTTHRSTSEPPSPHHKRVNFIPPYAAGHSHHASYPGVGRGRDNLHDHHNDHIRPHSSPSTPTRLSRSHSPRVHFSASHSGHGGRRRNFSDSECYSPTGETSGDDEESLALGGASSMESLSGWYRSRGRQGSSGHRRRAGSPSSQRRRFFVADADPELVGELFPEERHRAKTRQGSRAAKMHKTHPQSQDNRLGSYMDEVESRVKEKLAQLTRDHHQDKPDVDSIADAILQEAILEATEEATELERRQAAAERASAHIDNPTLENIMQALENMEKENERLRHKYCSVTFHDSVPRQRRYQKSSEVFAEFRSDQPREPPAFEVRNTRAPAQQSETLSRGFPSELSQEPLIFTKESRVPRSHPTLIEHHPDHHPPPPAASTNTAASKKDIPTALRPKILLSMKQTVVERIMDGVERFDYYQRGLKQHLGKHRPFNLYERVADNVLWQCCTEVAQELESINADMADNIYTSEFLSDTGLPLAPPQLASDFFLPPDDNTGTAAQNLRDSARAQRTVEAAVSRTVTSLMLPPEEPELSTLSPKRVIDTNYRDHDDDDDAASPRWDTSLKHVYDATALYEASITADKPAGPLAASVTSQQGKAGGGGAVKEDDTRVDVEEYDYDDDYTDISDDDDDDDGEEEEDNEGDDDYDDDDFDDGTGSPSP